MMAPNSFHTLKGAFAMRCARAQQKLEAYLGDEMPGRRRAELEQHLRDCTECSRALERARRLRAVVGGAHAPDVPAGFHARLMAQAARQAAQQTWQGRLARVLGMGATPAPLRAAALVAVAMALGTGVLVGREICQPGTPSPAEQARLAAADPVRIYRIDCFGEAPDDSLAGAYVALLSGGVKR
jgi:anti-sigma factor RsiW